MSKISREPREIIDAVPGTKSIAKDKYVKVDPNPVKELDTFSHPAAAPTPSRRDAAAAEDDLAHLPLHFRWSALPKKRTRVFTNGKGHWYRKGGIVRLTKTADGHRRFVIILYTGANLDDLKFLEAAVRAARQGQLKGSGWRKMDPQDYTWLVDGDDAYEYTCARGYREPFLHADRAPLVLPCSEPRCAAKYHSSRDYQHELDSTVKDKNGRHLYSIEVLKSVSEPDAPWSIDIDTSEFLDATPQQVAEFVNDLQWMAEECRRANEIVT